MMQVESKPQFIVFWGRVPWNVAFSSLGQPANIDNIEYQLFMVNTIEKWMCFFLAYRRKLRFNVFNLILQKKM